jgi:hypothetical protein
MYGLWRNWNRGSSRALIGDSSYRDLRGDVLPRPLRGASRCRRYDMADEE